MTSTFKVPASWRRAIVVGAVGLAISGVAAAGCGSYAGPNRAPVRWEAPTADTAMMTSALYVPGAAQFVRVHDEFSPRGSELVGIWRVTFTSDGTSPAGPPAGAQLDFATIQARLQDQAHRARLAGARFDTATGPHRRLPRAQPVRRRDHGEP